MKKGVIKIANYLRDNYGDDCSGIRRNGTSIRDIWYKIHFARGDSIDPREVWKFNPECGNSASDFDLTLINRHYFSAGKTLYAIRPLTYREAQNIPKVLILADQSEDNSPFTQALELVYSFSLGGDDSRSIMGSIASDADFTFVIDNVEYTVHDRTRDLAIAQWVVDTVREFYK